MSLPPYAVEATPSTRRHTEGPVRAGAHLERREAAVAEVARERLPDEDVLVRHLEGQAVGTPVDVAALLSFQHHEEEVREGLGRAALARARQRLEDGGVVC